MGVGDRGCALMRAQICAQHHISIIGGQTAGSKLVQTLGDRECALMCVQRAQSSTQHHISSIGGQTAGPIGAQFGTNTYWDNMQKLWGSAIGSAH
jgi:hypothetical protein